MAMAMAMANILILAMFIKNRSYFQLNAWKLGIYTCRFSGSANLLSLSIFTCDPKRSNSGHLDFIIDL